MTLQGKGFFIWKIPDCERGDPQGIASAAQEAGLTHVLIKIADGNTSFNFDPKTKVDRVGPVVSALRQRGIQVWGWHYIYGYDPLSEARIAIQRIQQLDLEGYVIDAEVEFELPDRATAARRYMTELRKALPNLPMALSSFRFPSYHPQIPWRVFLEYCNYNMPQVYWEKSHNPAEQLERVVKEFQRLAPFRPIIPTGPSYKWNGWRPTEADLQAFFVAVRKANLPAVNFFSWDECRRDLPELWKVISQTGFGPAPSPSPSPAPPPAEPVKDIPEQFIQALNTHNLDTIIKLYHPEAVHITAAQTLQGQAAIRGWYEGLLRDQLPEGKFRLSGSGGSGANRRLSWQASSAKARVENGNDTLGLKDGLIVYHYTSFTVIK